MFLIKFRKLVAYFSRILFHFFLGGWGWEKKKLYFQSLLPDITNVRTDDIASTLLGEFHQRSNIMLYLPENDIDTMVLTLEYERVCWMNIKESTLIAISITNVIFYSFVCKGQFDIIKYHYQLKSLRKPKKMERRHIILPLSNLFPDTVSNFLVKTSLLSLLSEPNQGGKSFRKISLLWQILNLKIILVIQECHQTM